MECTVKVTKNCQIENLQNVNVNKNLGKKIIINNMLPTKVCMFYELSEAILLFGLRYLHLDLLQFLHKYLSLYVQFCQNVFQSKIAPQLWKTGFPPHSQQTTRLVFLSDF